MCVSEGGVTDVLSMSCFKVLSENVFAGATETVEGGDELQAGFSPAVVLGQPARWRAGSSLNS